MLLCYADLGNVHNASSSGHASLCWKMRKLFSPNSRWFQKGHTITFGENKLPVNHISNEELVNWLLERDLERYQQLVTSITSFPQHFQRRTGELAFLGTLLCQRFKHPTTPNLSMTYRYYLRQFAALTCAITLAWDYFRAPEVLELFSVWALGLHFIYFQLPMKSRAFAYVHSCSFIAAAVGVALYCHLFLWKPSIETDRMELWDVTFSTIVTRACLLHFSPVVFHALDVSVNQHQIISAYEKKPRKIMYIWSLISFGLLGIIYNIVYPESEEYSNIAGIDSRDFLLRCRVITLIATTIGFTILWSLILRRAYPIRRHRSRSN